MALCLDEAIEPFKGRSKFVMYNPNKPHKWGIRLYILTCVYSAFTLKMEICQGKKNKDENAPNLEKLIISMCKQYKNKGYLFAMDNFYTMIGLFKKLNDLKFRALGTIRTNRLKLTTN